MTRSSMTDFQFHAQATEKLQEVTRTFYETVRLQAIQFAMRDRAIEVQPTHVEEANRILFAPLQKRRDFFVETFKIVGGGLMGAFFPGFIASLPTNGNPGDLLGLVVYTVMGLFGVALVVYATR